MEFDDRVGAIEHDAIPCLMCGDLISTATEITAQIGFPSLHGVPVICGECGEINVYVMNDGVLSFREPTIGELRVINMYFGPVLRQVAQLRLRDSSPSRVRPAESGESSAGD